MSSELPIAGAERERGTMSSVNSADDVKLAASLRQVCDQLMADPHSERLKRPLAFWVLPGDRRLPLAFLGRTIGELARSSFQELASTPGVGHKKMAALVNLLSRAATSDPVEYPTLPNSDLVGDVSAASADPDHFDPALVSEIVWGQWRETVRAHQIGHEKLGRLAPSLQSLPTVIWDSPLSFYLDKTLGEIRELKTHGEKRVQAVLEVFHSVFRMLAFVGQSGLAVLLKPRLIAGVQDWMTEARQREVVPDVEEVVARLVEPLMMQLETDVGTTVCKLARGRLGVGAPHKSVRQQSRELGLTRARIYQLLEDCHRTMSIRWPEGKRHLDEFSQRMDELYAPADIANLLGTLRELLYPLKYDSVAQHLLAERAQ
jgi:hypothetical protein